MREQGDVFLSAVCVRTCVPGTWWGNRQALAVILCLLYSADCSVLALTGGLCTHADLNATAVCGCPLFSSVEYRNAFPQTGKHVNSALAHCGLTLAPSLWGLFPTWYINNLCFVLFEPCESRQASSCTFFQLLLI